MLPIFIYQNQETQIVGLDNLDDVAIGQKLFTNIDDFRKWITHSIYDLDFEDIIQDWIDNNHNNNYSLSDLLGKIAKIVNGEVVEMIPFVPTNFHEIIRNSALGYLDLEEYDNIDPERCLMIARLLVNKDAVLISKRHSEFDYENYIAETKEKAMIFMLENSGWAFEDLTDTSSEILRKTISSDLLGCNIELIS